MSMKCRICDFCRKDFPGWEGFCEELFIDFTCLMCNAKNNSLHHSSDNIFSGQTFECNNCHNYIQYYDDDMLLYKYEFYYENLFVMNDFQDNRTYINFPEQEQDCIELPFIEFSDKDRFFKKIKSLIIFS